MSERQQKLEAALLETRSWMRNVWDRRTGTQILDEIEKSLATPPTSEWNEAIEAAASAADKVSQWSDDIAATIADDIRALKRKERT